MAARMMPLYNALKKEKGCEWAKAAVHVFQYIKTWLTQQCFDVYHEPTTVIGLSVTHQHTGSGLFFFIKLEESRNQLLYLSEN